MREKKKGGFVKGSIFGIVITLIITISFMIGAYETGAISILGTYAGENYSSGSANSKSDGSSSSDYQFDSSVMSKLNKILKLIDKYYLNEYDMQQLADGMFDGLLDSLGDPYSVYYDEDSYAALLESNAGSYYGIGVVIQQNPDTGEVQVVNPYSNCPGAEAGIRVGDVIVSIEGTEVTGMDLNEVVAMIRGASGTYVNVEVRHLNETQTVILSVERREIETPTVEYEMLENNVGYVRVLSFDLVTTNQFEEALENLAAQGMQGVIVDLRDNPGGDLDVVMDMMDMLLPKGVYTYLIDKNGNREDYRGTHNASYEQPMVVLVNENSASASELFTGAMKAYDRAVIVGTTTFGKGIVQQIIPIGDGTGIKVTMAKYYTPDDVCIHGIGIDPDYAVELDEGENSLDVSHEEDNQLNAAMEILEQMFGN